MDEDTLKMPTVRSPCCSRCLMHMTTMGGTLARCGSGSSCSSSSRSRHEASDTASTEHCSVAADPAPEAEAAAVPECGVRPAEDDRRRSRLFRLSQDPVE